jgi:hypothetical protein
VFDTLGVIGSKAEEQHQRSHNVPPLVYLGAGMAATSMALALGYMWPSRCIDRLSVKWITVEDELAATSSGEAIACRVIAGMAIDCEFIRASRVNLERGPLAGLRRPASR